jgi:hypothetical protein
VIGILHDSPLSEITHPDDCADRACSIVAPSDAGRSAELALGEGVSPVTIAVLNAVKSSAEMACAWAGERSLLWLEPPHVTQMKERETRAAIAHEMRRAEFKRIGDLLQLLYDYACFEVPAVMTLTKVSHLLPDSFDVVETWITAGPSVSSSTAAILSFRRNLGAIPFCTARATLTRAVLDNGCDQVLNRDFATKRSSRKSSTRRKILC